MPATRAEVSVPPGSTLCCSESQAQVRVTSARGLLGTRQAQGVNLSHGYVQAQGHAEREGDRGQGVPWHLAQWTASCLSRTVSSRPLPFCLSTLIAASRALRRQLVAGRTLSPAVSRGTCIGLGLAGSTEPHFLSPAESGGAVTADSSQRP